MLGKRHTKHSQTNVARLVETDRDCIVQEIMALLDDPVAHEQMGRPAESLRRWENNPRLFGRLSGEVLVDSQLIGGLLDVT